MKFPLIGQRFDAKRNFARVVYLSLAFLSFYLLYTSRADEVYTIWGTVQPIFILVFFAATLLLILIVFSSEETELKLVFSIVHSILSLSLYAIVFPFGRVGVPQMVLGEVRLVFDNITPLGLPSWSRQPAENMALQLYRWGRVYNLETLLTVVLSRMFSVDVYWVNLLFMPLLWGPFVPVITFAIARQLDGGKTPSGLSGLLFLVFPTLIFYGTFSNRNSLGFIFFLGSFYLFLRYLSSDNSKWALLMLLLSSASFLSHFMSGVMSFSLLILAVSFRLYQKTKNESLMEARITLLLAVFICVSLLPMFLLLHNFVYDLTASFSLGRLKGYSMSDVLILLVFGEFGLHDPTSVVVFGLGSLLGVIGMLYRLRSMKSGSNEGSRTLVLFSFVAFLVVLADYRILRLFMSNVPFEEERIWAFRDFIAVPFVSLLFTSFVKFIREKKWKAANGTSFRNRMKAEAIVSLVLLVFGLSCWITASVYHAYPAYSTLQTTTYEVEAVKYIDQTSNGTYIVIGDPWAIFAGEMFVGIQNPRAFYFFYQNPDGIALYTEMKNHPSNGTLIEAMEYNNASVAYFIVEQPRLGDQEFNRVISQAQQNGVAVYKIFGDGKLYIFYYRGH